MPEDFIRLRARMVEEQLAARGIGGPLILDAFRAVPRELFVDPALAGQAYEDRPLPIAAGQTVSQPYIVASMIAAAGVRPGHRVLEVGAGSGYAAAILGQIAGMVLAIERHGELAALASDRLERLGYSNVRIVEGDGSIGLREWAPYDAILVAAAGSHVPGVLLDQLAPGGALVMPVGPPGGAQHLVRAIRAPDGSFRREQLDAVRFVPLIGREGWPAERL